MLVLVEQRRYGINDLCSLPRAARGNRSALIGSSGDLLALQYGIPGWDQLMDWYSTSSLVLYISAIVIASRRHKRSRTLDRLIISFSSRSEAARLRRRAHRTRQRRGGLEDGRRSSCSPLSQRYGRGAARGARGEAAEGHVPNLDAKDHASLSQSHTAHGSPKCSLNLSLQEEAPPNTPTARHPDANESHSGRLPSNVDVCVHLSAPTPDRPALGKHP